MSTEEKKKPEKKKEVKYINMKMVVDKMHRKPVKGGKYNYEIVANLKESDSLSSGKMTLMFIARNRIDFGTIFDITMTVTNLKSNTIDNYVGEDQDKEILDEIFGEKKDGENLPEKLHDGKK